MKPVLVHCRAQIAFFAFFAITFFDSASTLRGQNESLRFTRLTVENGLSQNTVKCIVQDHDGFMWFGTQHGLNKYDGYNFTTFYHDPTNKYSLPNNDIGAMIEDHAGNLWFLANNTLCRLNREDKINEKFIRYDYVITGSAICEDDHGRLWLGAGYNFSQFDSAGDKIVQQLTAPGASFLSGDLPWSFFKDHAGAIWFGMDDKGILRLFQNLQGLWQFTPFNHNPANKNHLPPSTVFSIQSLDDHHEKILWLGMHGGGLCRMRLLDDRVVDCEHFVHDPSNPSSLSSNFVHTVFVDKAGTLWVGTTGGGLCKLIWNERGKAEFIRYQNDPTDPASLSDDDVWSIYQDRTGMIWVGTNGGGINKFDPQQTGFRHYRQGSANLAGLPNNNVWAFYQDRAGALWIGADSTLLRFNQRLNNAQGNFTHFALPTVTSTDVSRSQVRAICEDRAGTLWIGTVGCGLGKFDRAGGTFTFFTRDSLNPNSLAGNVIYALYGDSLGTLWIGMNSNHGGGLAKMWQEKTRGVQFKNYFSLSNGADGRLEWVTTIHPSRLSRQLWLGTWSKGLLRFDPQRESFTRYAPDSTNANSPCSATIFSIYEDSAGAVWLGTDGGGLDKLDPNTALVTHYTTRNGLADNVVYAILPDDSGNLWLSTNKGISKFNPRTESFQNFDVTDGLQGNEFNLGAALRARNGELYFGGNNGFNCFRPAELSTAPPEIVLTGFKKFNKEVLLDTPLPDLKRITLSYSDKFFTFAFAAMDYKNPTKNRYAYMMEGFDHDWIHLDNRHEASYTNLDPGAYTFRVKAANSDGVWNEKGIFIGVKILPPFWRTWWFALLALATTASFFIALHHYSMQQKLALKRAKFREREITQKTIAKNVHDDFGAQLSQISLASGRVKQQAPELPAPALETLDKIAGHATALSQLMKDFLWHIDPEKDTLYHLAEEWKNFGEIFDRTDIAFQLAGLTPEFDTVRLPLEWKQHLHLIFKEAMHNVIKHAAHCKNVTLAIVLSDGSLQVCLTNDGKGFDVANGRRGNGIQNMRQRAQELGGRLEILSEKTGGTTVRFIGKLPERPVAPAKKIINLKEVLRLFRRFWPEQA